MWDEAFRRLLDFTGERLRDMDAAGLDVQVLSLMAPGVQAETDPAVAVTVAASVNDLLASAIAENPTRFAGFAALPLQDPPAAARELERAVTQLGFRGAMVNAHRPDVELGHRHRLAHPPADLRRRLRPVS